MSAVSFAWKELDRRRKQTLPGATFQCSLFGRIDIILGDNGVEGVIPNWLQKEARKHGFRVIGADFRSDIYTFEVM